MVQCMSETTRTWQPNVLRRLMEDRGHSRMTVATVAGVWPQAVSNWLQPGNSGPGDYQKLARLAGLYDVEVDHFFEEAPDA